jgi:hypothetical protein
MEFRVPDQLNKELFLFSKIGKQLPLHGSF